MKKILSFIIAFAMIMSMSSVALAAGAVTVTNDAELLAAIQDPGVKTITIDGELTYDWGGDSYADSKALLMAEKTIVGKDGNDSITFKGYGSANPITDVTLKNITVKDETVGDDETAWEHGYLEFTNLTAENVTFSDIMLSGTCSLKKCKFVNNQSSWYAAWVEGGNVTFEECDFTGTRGAKIHEDYGSEVKSVTFDKCQFDLSEKPGVVIGTLNADTAVTIQNCHFVDCKAGDQDKYIYESDTGVTSFTFNADEGNHVCINGSIVSGDEKCAGTLNGTAGCNYSKPSEASAPAPKPASSGSGISVKYNGGNSFSTSKSDVPTGVEIDGVPVAFSGNGSSFTVSGIPANAKWVTVRWNSTSVTTNFTPSGAYVAEVNIPKTGDMPIWAAVAAFFGF